MEDFDFALACECIARANAPAGNTAAEGTYLSQAEAAGEAIQDGEDRKIFFESLRGGDWAGVGWTPGTSASGQRSD